MCSSFSDTKAERGVFERHAWEVMADLESFWALDKFMLNEQMGAVKWEQSRETVQYLVRRSRVKEGERAKGEEVVGDEKSHNGWNKILEEMAGTPE